MTVPMRNDHVSLSRNDARSIVALATVAPSVHNTQPWSWRIVGETIELYADLERWLAAEDPLGRSLVISCGTALHHAQVAARALGWETTVDRMPEEDDPTMLARIRLTASGEPADLAVLGLLRERRTDRRRFTSWPVPAARLQHLAEVAGEWDCHAVPLLQDTDRIRMDQLMERAVTAQAANRNVSEEQQHWIDRSRTDGVPSRLVPTSPDPAHNRFGPGLLPERDPEPETSDLEATDGVIVLGGTTDDAGAWLRTGEGLSALWLKATEGDLSVVPLSQPIEFGTTRVALRREILGGLIAPHLVLRVGWQAIGRSHLPPSPRRPVDDVLRP